MEGCSTEKTGKESIRQGSPAQTESRNSLAKNAKTASAFFGDLRSQYSEVTEFIMEYPQILEEYESPICWRKAWYWSIFMVGQGRITTTKTIVNVFVKKRWLLPDKTKKHTTVRWCVDGKATLLCSVHSKYEGGPGRELDAKKAQRV